QFQHEAAQFVPGEFLRQRDVYSLQLTEQPLDHDTFEVLEQRSRLAVGSLPDELLEAADNTGEDLFGESPGVSHADLQAPAATGEQLANALDALIQLAGIAPPQRQQLGESHLGQPGRHASTDLSEPPQPPAYASEQLAQVAQQVAQGSPACVDVPAK